MNHDMSDVWWLNLTQIITKERILPVSLTTATKVKWSILVQLILKEPLENGHNATTRLGRRWRLYLVPLRSTLKFTIPWDIIYICASAGDWQLFAAFLGSMIAQVKKSVNHLRTVTSIPITQKWHEEIELLHCHLSLRVVFDLITFYSLSQIYREVKTKRLKDPLFWYFLGKHCCILGCLERFRHLRKKTKLKFFNCCGNFKVHYVPFSHRPIVLLYFLWKTAMWHCFMTAIIAKPPNLSLKISLKCSELYISIRAYIKQAFLSKVCPC